MSDKRLPRTDVVPVTPYTPGADAQAVDALLEACRVPPAGDAAPDAESPSGWNWSRLPVADDRYQVTATLAHGGMGILYLASDKVLGRRVAVKVLRGDQLGDPTAVLRFLQEGRIHAQLQHPGIPPLHDVGRFADGRPFIAMKYIEGETLAELLPGGPPDEARRATLLDVFWHVARAVAYAHAKGVLHRDLTPNNVIVSGRGRVQVIDWGLAKVQFPEAPDPADNLDGTACVTVSNVAHTAEGVALGTPAFIPPEQAGGRRDDVDAASDVFGLGAILCHVLTGEPPYVGGPTEVRRRALAGDLTEAHQRLDRCGAPAGWVRLAKACLDPSPARRPANGAAVVRAVHDLRSRPAAPRRPWWSRLFG